MFWSVVFFAVLIHLLGVSVVLAATGRRRLDFETHVLSTGVGLGAFPLVAVLLNSCGVPLVWWTFLAAGGVLLALGLVRSRLSPDDAGQHDRRPFLRPENVCLLIAILLTLACFAVFLSGTFSAPWLTDDDSWVHARTLKHIVIHRSYSIAPEVRHNVPSYIEPYPPGYPVLMAVLQPLNGSVQWTLKFFNVAVIALGIVYFYLMMKEWTGRASTALWMTGVLWVLPCFMSHFIWAQSLALVLFFPAFCAMERTVRERGWGIVAAVVIAGVLLSQPSAAVIFGIMAVLYWGVNLLFTLFGRDGRFPLRALLHQAASGVGGVLLSAAFYLPGYIKFGRDGFFFGVGRVRLSTLAREGPKLAGTGWLDRYGLWDFLHAPASTRINQPTGIGIVLFLITCAGLVLLAVRLRHATQRRRHVVTLLWLALTLVGVLGNYFDFSLFPHRFWAFFAIPVAMVAGEFLAFVAESLPWKHLSVAVAAGGLLGLLLGLVGTSAGIASTLDAPDGASLGYTLTVAFAVAGCLVAAAFRLVDLPEDTKRVMRSVALGLLVLGVALTSGYAKVRFEGSSAWPPGVHFYRFAARNRDGRPVMVDQHLLGFVEIRRTKFRPDTPMLAVDAPPDHLIGFDMFSPPYDLELRRFRTELDEMGPRDLDDGLLHRMRELARTRKLEFVVVTPHRVADLQYNARSWQKRIANAVRNSGIGEDRLQKLLDGPAVPTEREKPFVDYIRTARDRQLRLLELSRDTTTKIQRLREMLGRSNDFALVYDSGPYGVAVFRVK